tara:strand:- start:246 stop:1400 length:1155 start_codon:yes stop_codon:yes gene_type:complete
MGFPKLSISDEWKNLNKFKKLSDDERSIVFYAENKASMNHFRTLISELTENLDLQICYVTSVKDDPIFSSNNNKILSFYIGDGVIRTQFFLTLKAKTLIMDMPDLQTFHIKRSKVYPVHYIYIFHSMFSVHSYLRKKALDNYDTIFCVGQHHIDEILESEKRYNLKPKKLIKYGFGRLDTLLKEKNTFENSINSKKNLIIIAPSYGKNNLLHKCGIQLIEILLKSNFQILLRPHYKTINESQSLIDSIIKNFGENPNFSLERGIIPFESFYNSKCMISDWSGISMEYAFTFEKPVIFLDVPKKILNPDYDEIELEPIEISIREKIGYVILPNNLGTIPKILNSYENSIDDFNQEIKNIRSKTVFNIENSGKIGAEYISELISKA